MLRPMTVPSSTFSAAKSVVVPCRLQSWVIVPARPFFIGRPGWVRSSAWIRLFSSTESTMACAGGSRWSPTTSRSFSTRRGSFESLNCRTRCGCRPCARQMRRIELTLMPAAFAIMAAVQWVVSAGGSVSVSATTRSATSGPSGGTRDGRVLSRGRPSTPSVMDRACQRQTHGLDLPVRRMISAVPKPSAVARMMPARHTCFCGLFRSATTASNRARSAALTSMLIPLRIHRDSHKATALGILRQVSTTRGVHTTLSQPPGSKNVTLAYWDLRL